MDPLQWMDAADKNITIVHATPVHQLMSCEEKHWVFAKTKQIHHKDIFEQK